jgi:signal transduction histidine kinase
MNLGTIRRQTLLSWLFVGALAILSLVLVVLQYHWTGDISRAERDRLHSTLEASLRRLSQEFNVELTAACLALLPDRPGLGEADSASEYAERYSQWLEGTHHTTLFRRVGLLRLEHGDLALRMFTPESGSFDEAPWPQAWDNIRREVAARVMQGPGRGPALWRAIEDSQNLIVIPHLLLREDRRRRGPPRELEWLIVEVNVDYVRTAILPQLLQRHLGTPGSLDYQAAIVMADDPSVLLYETPDSDLRTLAQADASVRLFDVRMDLALRRTAGFRGIPPLDRGPGFRAGRRPSPPGEMPAERGRWLLLVRHRAGSLDAVVAKARARNLAVSTGVVLLILAAAVALVRFSRRAQQLADLQMEFVAGVSHELRTPLTVMRTAGHNLQGRVSGDPPRVQEYGALIEDEAEKLSGIVERVLRFANINAGRAIERKQPVLVESVLEEALEAERRLVSQAGCRVEKRVEDGLAPVMGDATALKHAFQNLIANAAKYGKEGGWIGVFASMREMPEPGIEIRIADHGPGIPPEEVTQIFDPFFRGKKAVAGQVHGTGLGLSLARRIIEAHDGTISVRSNSEGAEFVITLPAGVKRGQNELENTTG